MIRSQCVTSEQLGEELVLIYSDRGTLARTLIKSMIMIITSRTSPTRGEVMKRRIVVRRRYD